MSSYVTACCITSNAIEFRIISNKTNNNKPRHRIQLIIRQYFTLFNNE